jgi:hypothetical protein
VAGGINANAMMSGSNKVRFVLVDPYIPYFSETDSEKNPDFHTEKMAEMLRTVDPHQGRFEHVRKTSVEAAKDYPDGFFDFVYIDGDHSKEAVQADVTAWRPKVKTGGMLSGHDWSIVGPHIKDMVVGAKFDAFNTSTLVDD